jgi:hypothetical protein
MQQQLVTDMNRVDLALFLGTERMLEEARRASPEFRAAKREQAKTYRRRRLTVIRWRLLAIVGR